MEKGPGPDNPCQGILVLIEKSLADVVLTVHLNTAIVGVEHRDIVLVLVEDGEYLILAAARVLMPGMAPADN